MKLLPIVLGVLFLLPVGGYSEGALQFQPTAVYMDEGDAPIAFSVQCASITWTALRSADNIRRALLVHGLSGNSTAICISTITTVGYACQDSTPGIELVGTSSWTDYSTVAWYCRARQTAGAADTRGYLKGFASRDKGDYGRQ